MKSKIIAGIELGSSKIATLIAQVAADPVTFESTINIIGAATSASRGIRKGQIVDIEEAVEATIASVEAAERMSGYNLSSCFVAVSGAHVHSQNSHGVVAVSDPEGEISPEDVNRVIEAASAVSLPQSREVVHVLPREFIVDGESGVKDPIGMTGVRLEVETHMITAAAASIKNLKKALNEVGVEVEGLVFSGLAASEAVLSSTEKELGCVLIDIGAGTTSVAVFSDGALCSSFVFPIGAMNVTNDLAIGLRISIETAEKIKLALSKKTKSEENEKEIDLSTFGSTDVKNISKKTLIEGIIKPRLNEIFTYVRIELEKQGYLNKVPSGAVLTGGGAEIVGVTETAKRMLSLPIRIGKPSGVGGLIDDVINPAFATTMGLIIYGSKTQVLDNNSLTTLKSRIKLPSSGILGKLIDTVKDLLP
ncbi:cell division protein FtsA [Candidatus Woesebacteria bacterium]|nr:cell division protein FtsA [Candidatus Woesebacteria bacterium]